MVIAEADLEGVEYSARRTWILVLDIAQYLLIELIIF